MQEMPGYEYAPEEGGAWKRRFEITIPLLLLILVILVVAWKMGWLASIPFIGDFFKSPSINILVVGNDQTLIQTLETTIKTELPINVFTVSAADLTNILDSAYYNKYNMIILTEGAADDTVALPSLTLDHIKSFVDGGKPAIVIMNAGTKIIGDEQAKGWARLGFVPAECAELTQISCATTSASYTQITLKLKDSEHATLKDYAPGPLNFSAGTIDFTDVHPSSTGKALLTAEITIGTTAPPMDAILERTGMLTSKVVYFAFHPSHYAPLLKNVIKYLR